MVEEDCSGPVSTWASQGGVVVASVSEDDLTTAPIPTPSAHPAPTPANHPRIVINGDVINASEVILLVTAVTEYRTSLRSLKTILGKRFDDHRAVYERLMRRLATMEAPLDLETTPTFWDELEADND